MVDINLFKDDDEEEKEEGNEEGKKRKEKNSDENSQDDKEDLSGDLDDGLGFGEEEELSGDFKEDQDADFNLDDELEDGLDEDSDQKIDDEFDKELGDESSLDDDEFLDDELGDEEEIPDFEEKKEKAEDEDYSFGEVKKKGVSPFLLILLGIVVVVALGYQFVYKPKLESLKELQNSIPEKPDIQKLIEQQRKQLSASKKDSTSSDRVALSDSVKKPTKKDLITKETITTGTNIEPTVLAKNTGSLIEYLSQNNCLGTVIIDTKDKFFRAGYASLKPNVANEIATRIKSIFNIEKYDMSPEDSYKTNGRVRYWGVISGELSDKVNKQAASTKNFNSAQSFKQWLEQSSQNYSLSFKEGEIFPTKSESGKTIIPIRIKVEGDRKNLINYLTLLMQKRGNYSIDKMIITPVNITDFKGEMIKFVINLTLII